MNIKEKAEMILNIKELLYGVYKPHEYERVILPMTTIKRFNDCLLSGNEYNFSNNSSFTFETLLKDEKNIEKNFKAYLNGFSENVLDVLNNFKFDEQVKILADNNLLYYIIKEFNSEKGYLGDDKVTSIDMGYIYEELVKQFTEKHSDKIGAHFTSRDIIYLMTDLLLFEQKDILDGENVEKSAYDMTMGTSQMLGCMEERLREINNKIKFEYYGQELNPFTTSIAKSDALIKGRDSNNMKQGNTLTDDKFKDCKFDYIISNPPYGVSWKKDQKEIEKEHKLGDKGRFKVGLPNVNDGQMLFMLNGIKKLKDDGKMAILHNGSPLFTGDAGSGASEIRRYIIENDWLDAIVQLSDDAFYNTPITTYIWIISKNKPHYRQGKVQLIDASKCFEKRRKSIGKKRNDITEVCRELIIKAYEEFENKEYTLENGISCESKIFDNIDFGYNKIIIETPQLDEEGNVVRKGKKIVADTKKRDSENVPLDMDIDAYFEREVKPYNNLAWIDKNKTKVGYEIPFTRYFYKYTAPEKSDDIAKRIYTLETEIVDSINVLFARLVSSMRNMKDSGIEWIGEIPKDWKIVRLKIICDLENGFSFKSCDYIEESNTLCCRMSNIRPNGVFDISYSKIYLPDSYVSKYKSYLLKDKDIIIAMTDMASDPKILGVPTEVKTDGYNLLLNQRVGKLIIKNNSINKLFLKYSMSSKSSKYYFTLLSDKNIQINLSKENLLNIFITYPSLEEQELIANYLDNKVKKIDNIISKKQELITQLENYKKSLIYEYVTGKKEVPR